MSKLLPHEAADLTASGERHVLGSDFCERNTRMSDDLIEIRVPMVVTADGRWAVMGSHATVGDPDWSYVDEMCDYDNPTVAPRRYWITAYVKKPEIGEIAGAAIPEKTRTK